MASPFFIVTISIEKIIIWLIHRYQINISSKFGRRCRFQITCSQYSIESIRTFGILKGIWITLLRILQCHPLTFNNKKSQYFSSSNSQDTTHMSSQRYFFILIFLIISFILWQTWQTEYNSNINTQTKNIHQKTYSSSNIINNHHEISSANEKNQIITVITDVFLLKINKYGGNIEEAYLNNYLQNLNYKKPLHLLNNSPKNLYQINSGITTEYLTKKSLNNNTPLFTTLNNQNNYVLLDHENTLRVQLIYHDPNGITYTKNYNFNRGDYAVRINYDIKNMSTYPLTIRLFGNLIQSVYNLKSENDRDDEDTFPLYSYRGTAYSTNKEKYQKYNLKNIKNADLNLSTNSGWIAMLQKYFVTAWVPYTQTNNTFYTTYHENNNFSIGFISDPIYIPKSQQHTLKSILWIGPKIQENMKKIAPNLDLVIDYGWLWFISQPLFKLLNCIYNYVNNWGIAIIIITLGIRLIMYPLTKAQYTSMAKIRMLQPKISLIQQEYKHDKYQYHQKTLELYKKEKVNPLGGCLPLLIQMPIFLALYYMLSGSVELRHAKFAFWIYDLSSKDPFYILPILMGITMFFIQKISPTTISDPMQKKIMNITLIIFTIFFLWFPSGLVLYYIISNIITIIQQQIIYHGLKKQGLHPKL